MQVSALYRPDINALSWLWVREKLDCPKLLCKAQFTRFTMILMSLVILKVFAAYKRKRVFSITGHLETWFSESWKKKAAAQFTCFMVVSIRVVQNMSYHSLTDPLRDTWGGVKSEGWTDHFNNNKMISMSVVYSLSFSPLSLFFGALQQVSAKKMASTCVGTLLGRSLAPLIGFYEIWQLGWRHAGRFRSTLHLLRPCSS